MAKILLVEDEKNIASFIERGLTELEHEVDIAGDGVEALEILRDNSFDMLIVDVIMPRMNGLQLCRQYRAVCGYAVPVLMLTALSTTDDIVAGLDAGADDYLVKPFSFQELEARINALLRRKNIAVEQNLSIADLTLNCATRRAHRGNVDIDLTDKEFRLLECFLRNKGTVLSRMELLKDVWDKDFDTNTNVVDVYVNYLRNKVDKNFERRLIHTVIGMGYMMDDK
ncbi:MAG: response regulator transcription factor [Prevotella sp.]|nr:response regulator transcription factor [Prevotella sp.]